MIEFLSVDIITSTTTFNFQSRLISNTLPSLSFAAKTKEKLPLSKHEYAT